MATAALDSADVDIKVDSRSRYYLPPVRDLPRPGVRHVDSVPHLVPGVVLGRGGEPEHRPSRRRGVE